MPKTPAKTQAKPSRKPAEDPRARALRLLEQVGGPSSLVVAVFRRGRGSEKPHVGTYAEDEFSPEQVLQDHGPGFYWAQVKEDNRIITSRNFSVGDVSALGAPPDAPAAPAQAAPPTADTGMMPVILEGMRQQGQVTVALIQAMGGTRRDGDGLTIKDILPMLQDRAGIGDALKAIEVARGLAGVDDTGPAPAPNDAGLLGLIGKVAEAIPAAIRELRGQQAEQRKHVDNTAQQNPTPRAGSAEAKGKQPGQERTTGVPASDARPGAAKAASTPGADAPPAGPIEVPPLSQRQPFPGARALLLMLNEHWPMILGAMGVPEMTPEAAAKAEPAHIIIGAQALLEAIDQAGADPLYVFDTWDMEKGGKTTAEALLSYAPCPAMESAWPLLLAIDLKAREMSAWESEHQDDNDQDDNDQDDQDGDAGKGGAA